MRSLYISKFLDAHYDDELAFFRIVWKDSTAQMKDEQLKQELLHYVSYFHLKPKGVLHNMQQFRFVVPPELQEWIDQNINSKALEVGIKKAAFVVAPELFAAVSVEQTMDEENGKQLTNGFFDEETKAWNWLKS